MAQCRSRIPARIPVYTDGRDRGTPYTYVDVQTASDWIATGLAKRTNKRGRSITLFARRLVALRGKSCSIKLYMIIEALCGSSYYAALIEGWAPQSAPSRNVSPNPYVRPDCPDHELLMPVDVYLKVNGYCGSAA